MPKERIQSTQEENVEALRGAIGDIEKGWNNAQGIKDTEERTGALRMLEERRTILLQKLARLEQQAQFKGAVDLSKVPDLEAYHERDANVGRYAELIAELNHQLQALQVEKLEASNPLAIDREIARVESEIQTYQKTAELQQPPDPTRQ